MRAELQEFLAAEDLDALLAARMAITAIGKSEAAELSQIVANWTNPQAVANLLMYPEVIPAPDRLGAVLKGLNAADGEYAVLAAVVGLPRLGEEDVPEKDRSAIAARLVHLIQTGSGPIATRAAQTLATYVEYADLDELVSCLSHPDEAVRHNVLVAALQVLGPRDLMSAVQRLVGEGRLAPPIADQVAAQLTRAGIDPDAEDVDAEQLRRSRLGLPLLGHIPNLQDWPPGP